MHKQLISYHALLIFITVGSLLLAACTQTNTVESSLQGIQSILTAGNTNNDVHYQLSYDPDFPCNAQLQENWKDDDNNWQHTYRFDLTNIKSNTFVQSKSSRRAIIYSGYKVETNGTKKTFSEKRINNIRYRATLSNEDQQLLLTSINKAIALCEEKYSF